MIKVHSAFLLFVLVGVGIFGLRIAILSECVQERLEKYREHPAAFVFFVAFMLVNRYSVSGEIHRG